jgi:PIN domain nuclease of toxin-antitoxin system
MILLDTHSLVWWVNEDQKLSSPARACIKDADQIVVSSITAWEIALLIKAGRLRFTARLEDWLAGAEAIPNLSFIPVGNNIALAAVNLPDPFHKDPADRIIVATARTLACPVVTGDGKIRAYPYVKTLW